jgi:hypothetical protein
MNGLLLKFESVIFALICFPAAFCQAVFALTALHLAAFALKHLHQQLDSILPNNNSISFNNKPKTFSPLTIALKHLF